ncbi:MAG: hypothetical protein QM485_07870 [Flavobacteriaceae bacterium]
MDSIQTILVYVIVVVALGYLFKKYFLPKTLFSSKKAKNKSCGNDSCGCNN